MLTHKQHQLLVFIDARLRDAGVPPSFEEMKEALGLRSKSGIHRLITALEERGFIRRLPHRARALEVLKPPAAPESGALASEAAKVPSGVRRLRSVRGFRPGLIEGTLGKSRAPVQENSRDLPGALVPMMGKIAAGVPVSAIQDHSTDIAVPLELLRQGEHYALKVEGDSMVEAGIIDGDTVIIRRTETASNGDIVVALIDDEEATLKRLRRKGDSIALEAANSAYETRIFGPGRVRVQGTLAGLIRRFGTKC